MRELVSCLLLALALCALLPRSGSAQERQDRPRIELDSLRARRERLAPSADSARAQPRPDVRRAEPAAADTPNRVVPRPPGGAPPAAALPADSLIEALARLEGYTVTHYTGSAASFHADSGAVTLVGPATIDREGQNIAADSLLTFDRASGVVCGYGSPVLSGEGNPINSDQICYDTERRLGMALGARTEFAQNANWFVHGERVFTVGSDVVYSAGTEFTTCDLEVPHYHFTASRFKMVNDNILVARDVTLSFGDVPVFWLPFLVQSMREGRRSGLLTPSFGLADVVQTSSGHTRDIRNLGFFWAINDYAGLEAALGWRSNQWLSLRGGFDYRWTRQFLQGSLNASQFFRDGGDRTLAFRTTNSWQPGERTSVRATGSYSSSSSFVRRNEYDPTALTRALESNASINHQFRNGAQLNFGASRSQELLEERVSTTLPSFGLSLPAITLAAPEIGGMERELTWQGSLNYSRDTDDRDDTGSQDASDRDSDAQSASLGSSFRFADLNITQSFRATEANLHAKPAVTIDTLTSDPLAAQTTRDINWSSGVSYRQDLVGSLRVTPQLSVNGRILESPLTGDVPVTAPVSLNFGARLEADVFGFWPGFGPFERMRHKISPSLAYNYRPEPDQSALQDSIFGASTRGANRIELQFNQTFEVKRPAEEGADSAGDAASDDLATASDEPRRLAGQTPIRLLAINTTALAYDFEAASRGEEGFTTTRIGNTLTSDLLRGMTVRLEHSLFAEESQAVTGDRHFDLHLESVNASFGLSGESWLFRILGLGNETRAETPQEEAVDTLDAQQLLPSGSDRNIVPDAELGSRQQRMDRLGSSGTWNASFVYSLARPRDPARRESQQIGATIAFQPTENWSVGWSTDYSVTDSEFQSNNVTLTRALHRWEADFRIMRAQNGNFAFEFEARLSDLPDIKVPYDQRSQGDIE